MSEQTEAEMVVAELEHSPELIHKLQRLLGLSQVTAPAWPIENDSYAACFIGNWKVELTREPNGWNVHLSGGPFGSAEEAKSIALIAAQTRRAG